MKSPKQKSNLETNIFPPKHHHNKSYRIWMEVHLYVVKFVVIDRHIWSKLDARKKSNYTVKQFMANFTKMSVQKVSEL